MDRAQRHSGAVTDEAAAGACGLDGEQLTQLLLEENQELQFQVEKLRQMNQHLIGGLAILGSGSVITILLILWITGGTP
ncbi:hypothetical protein D9M70_555570 [compost metagenome]